MTNFKPQELLPKEIFEAYGDAGLRYIDNRILQIMDYIRKVFEKPVIINDWADGGQFNERTIRLPVHGAYKLYSDHSWGRAADFDVVGLDSLEVQRHILKDTIVSTVLKGLGMTGIEDMTMGWTHVTVASLDGWQLPELNGFKLIPQK